MHFKERNPVFAETNFSKILKEADDSGSYFKIIVCITNVPKSMQIKLGDFPISESVRVIVFSEVSILLFEVKDDFTEACGAWLGGNFAWLSQHGGIFASLLCSEVFFKDQPSTPP